jgi:hypothetical protein
LFPTVDGGKTDESGEAGGHSIAPGPLGEQGAHLDMSDSIGVSKVHAFASALVSAWLITTSKSTAVIVFLMVGRGNP